MGGVLIKNGDSCCIYVRYSGSRRRCKEGCEALGYDGRGARGEEIVQNWRTRGGTWRIKEADRVYKLSGIVSS